MEKWTHQNYFPLLLFFINGFRSKSQLLLFSVPKYLLKVKSIASIAKSKNERTFFKPTCVYAISKKGNVDSSYSYYKAVQ